MVPRRLPLPGSPHLISFCRNFAPYIGSVSHSIPNAGTFKQSRTITRSIREPFAATPFCLANRITWSFSFPLSGPVKVVATYRSPYWKANSISNLSTRSVIATDEFSGTLSVAKCEANIPFSLSKSINFASTFSRAVAYHPYCSSNPFLCSFWQSDFFACT